jgi:hypothetical protein
MKRVLATCVKFDVEQSGSLVVDIQYGTAVATEAMRATPQQQFYFI